MTPHQANVALRLVNKVLPDLRAVAVQVEDTRDATQLSTADLYQRVLGGAPSDERPRRLS
jgi:hypothetical protein